jgi:hypothetical protein
LELLGKFLGYAARFTAGYVRGGFEVTLHAK